MKGLSEAETQLMLLSYGVCRSSGGVGDRNPRSGGGVRVRTKALAPLTASTGQFLLQPKNLKFHKNLTSTLSHLKRGLCYLIYFNFMGGKCKIFFLHFLA